MNKKILFFCLISFILCKQPYEKENDILVLNDLSFTPAMKQFKYLLVLFYDPKDTKSQQFIPEYEKIAFNLQKEYFFFAKINSIQYKNIADNYEIKSVPTLILLKNGKKINFQGEKTAENIEKFLKEKTRPKIKRLKMKKDLEHFKKDNEVALVYFGKNESVIEELVIAERKMDNNIPMATIDLDDVIQENFKKEKNKKNEGFIMFKHYDDKKVVMKEKMSVKNLIKFSNNFSNPKCLEYNKESHKIIFDKRNPIVFIFSTKSERHYGDSLNLFNYMFKSVKGRFKLGVCDVKDEFSKKLADFCGMNEKNIPKVVIVDPRPETPLKYEMSGGINEENIMIFANKFLKGKLKPFLRSEEVPKDNDGDIFILVGKTFKQYVINNIKDVLVYFDAPSCKFCKEFEPKLAKLAKALKESNPNLLIAKMDGTVNDVEEYQIHQYPTIKFYPGNTKDKEPLTFIPTNDINELLGFIKKNAYNKINEIDPNKHTDL